MKISQKLISFILVITMSMGVATLPAFASSYPDTQSSGNSSWYVPWQNTSHSIYAGESIGNILRSFAQWNDTGLGALYNRMGGISSNIQDVVTAIGNIPGATDYSTILNSIDSKIVDYTTNFASVENKLQSMINNLINLNTGLTSVNTTLGSGTSSDNILIRLRSLVTSNNSINTNSSSILTALTNYVGNSTSIHRRYGVNSGIYSTLNVDGLSIPTAAGSDSSNIGSYSMVYSATNNNDLLDFIGNGNIISNFILSKIWTPLTQYREYYINDNFQLQARVDNDNKPVAYLSIADMIYDFDRRFDLYFAKLQYALADDDTIAAKNANKPQEQNVLYNFTGSGSASASTNDFTGVKDSVSALKTSLSGGASYTQAFNILDGSSDGWSWFTNEVAESMDSTSNGNTRLRSVSNSTPYLDSYYEQLSSYLGYSYNGGIE